LGKAVSGGADLLRSVPPEPTQSKPERPSRRTPSHFQTGSEDPMDAVVDFQRGLTDALFHEIGL